MTRSFQDLNGDTEMTAITSLQNHQIRLASRPVGLPTRANWSSTTEPVAALFDTPAIAIAPNQ